MDFYNFLFVFTTGIILPRSSYGYAVEPPCPALSINNGRVFYNNEEKTASFTCLPGFRLFGESTIRCRSGTWDRPGPLCYNTEPGCPVLRNMPNGHLVFQGSGKGVAFANCNQGFGRVGSSILYCNGTHWNATLPACKPMAKQAVRTKASSGDNMRSSVAFLPAKSDGNRIDCDFEIPCVWSQSSGASYRWTVHDGKDQSGPANAFSGKNYLYARPSSYGNQNDTAVLFSPLLTNDKDSSCLTFRYYIDGIRSRVLLVRGQRNTSSSWQDELVFRINNTKDSNWRTAQLSLPPKIMRVAIEAQKGNPHSAEIAIDDLRFTQSTNCSLIGADLIRIPPKDIGNESKSTTPEVAFPRILTTTDWPLTDTYNSTAPLTNAPMTEPVPSEVNIDIYEWGTNRSFVDEPSQFTVQVVQLHSATINPVDLDNRGYLGYLTNRSARIAPDALSSTSDSTDAKSVPLIAGATIGAAVLAMVLLATGFMIMLKRRSQRKQKPITEETEFQYFSYSNDGFREANATLPADQVNKR